MSLYVRLETPPCPPMTDPSFMDAVQAAADQLRAAEPWLLVPYGPTTSGEVVRYVARRRSLAMLVVTALVNVWRRPRRWWLGRLQKAMVARAAMTPNRN